MTDSNRTQVSYVQETTLGTTPTISGTTVMRTARLTGESLGFSIQNVTSQEIRADRMYADIIQVDAQSQGDLNFELSYPLYRTYHEQFMASGMYANWTNLPVKHNITADSELANVGAGTGVYTVDAGGALFLANHVVRASGFTNSANNGIFTVTSSGATSVTTGNSSSVSETAPPVDAMLKVVGIQGASGDIQTTTSGGNLITTSALNFINLGFRAGMWIKVGDASNTAFSFATSALNTFMRVTAVTATQLTVDNLPSGVSWSTDNGSSKTIRIFMSDEIKNGTTQIPFTIEKGFLGQATPSYLVFRGMVVGAMSLSLNASQLITGSYSLMGLSHAASTSSLGTPVAATTEDILSAAANVGRFAENDTDHASPSLVQQLTINTNNNLRLLKAIGTLGGVGMGAGSFDVGGSITAYFGDLARYNRYVNGTVSSLNFRTTRAYASGTGSRALFVTVPAAEFTAGNVVAQGINQDVFAQINFQAKLNSTYNAHLLLHKMDYWN